MLLPLLDGSEAAAVAGPAAVEEPAAVADVRGHAELLGAFAITRLLVPQEPTVPSHAGRATVPSVLAV